MELDPTNLSVAERYKLLIGCITPRPIAFVSTVSVAGRANLAPFSFFNGVGSDPMTLLFCPANGPDGRDKDTLRNVDPETGVGQFVVNAAVEGYVRQVAAAAEALAWGESEFELTGLTPVASRVVAPPRVGESPVAFECETMQVVRTNPGAPAGGNVVIGRVVHVHVRDGLIDDGLRTDQDRLRTVGRMGGRRYCTTRDQFELPPTRAALDEPDPLERVGGKGKGSAISDRGSGRPHRDHPDG